MDNVGTLYHGGNVEEDVYGNVSFDGMKKVAMIFDDKPLLSEIFARACDELHCNSNDLGISVEWLLHYGKSGNIFQQLISIGSQSGISLSKL
jgi:hypothetical protein